MIPHNPFSHRKQIHDPQAFIGRAHVIERVLGLLDQGQSVAIVGPRRIGKSSLLAHLVRPQTLIAYGAEPQRYCFVSLSCENIGTITPSAFYDLVSERLLEQWQRQGNDLPTLPSTHETGYRRLEMLAHAINARGRQIVFLLDEFDQLCNNHLFDAGVFSNLRALATSCGLAYVTVTRVPLLDLTFAQSSVLSSPFFNIFAQERLRLFTTSEAELLLGHLSALGGQPFSPQTITWLLELAGPHPYLLQLAGFHAFGLGYERDDSPLDDAFRREVQQRFMDAAEAHWLYALRFLQPEDRRLLALLPLCWQQEVAGVQRLINSCLVVRQPTGEAQVLAPSLSFFLTTQIIPPLLQGFPVVIDPKAHLVMVRERKLELRPTEFRLLCILVEHKNEFVSHEMLKKELGGQSDDGLKNAIGVLRKGLHEHSGDKDCIVNERGIGYKFVSIAP